MLKCKAKKNFSFKKHLLDERMRLRKLTACFGEIESFRSRKQYSKTIKGLAIRYFEKSKGGLVLQILKYHAFYSSQNKKMPKKAVIKVKKMVFT